MGQPATGGDESMAAFVERRRREVGGLGRDAESAGREAWHAATRVGQNLAAARPSDVLALGARALGGENPAQRPVVASARDVASGARNGSIGFGGLRADLPGADDTATLRRQQACFAAGQRSLDRLNRWMAVPALAPAAVVLGLEGAGAVAARMATAPVARAPLQLTEPDPYIRVGDNWATRAGRRAHDALKARLDAKPNWDYEPKYSGTDGGKLKPDVGAPARNPEAPDRRRLMELKPDTPTGRQAGERAIKKYRDQTKNPARVIYYNPKDYL